MDVAVPGTSSPVKKLVAFGSLVGSSARMWTSWETFGSSLWNVMVKAWPAGAARHVVLKLSFDAVSWRLVPFGLHVAGGGGGAELTVGCVGELVMMAHAPPAVITTMTTAT